MEKSRLKEFIRKIVREVFQDINEITTTGNVAGYDTPFAFYKPKTKKTKSRVWPKRKTKKLGKK